MISDEVQMLINRMKSNPEEFRQEIVGSEDSRAMRMGKWTLLMNSLINNKASLEIVFTPEELKALKQAATEILRPDALATIVRTIVGGASTPEEMYQQMEMEYTHPQSKKLEALQDARVAHIKAYLASQQALATAESDK